MTDLEHARKQWIADRPLHSEFGDLVASRLREALRPLGFWFEVTSRAKDVDSLIKKLIKKPKHSYESLPDKVGARVVVRYRSEIEQAVQAAKFALGCGNADDKLRALGVDKVGYQSVHLDGVHLLDSDPESVRFPASAYWVELQVRTLAQHLWSEMSHDTVYKNEETIEILPEDVKRRVNLMAGQIEIADREFDRLDFESPANDEIQLLRFLERYFYTFTSRRPDTELSLQILHSFIPIYQAPIGKIQDILGSFLTQKQQVIEAVYERAASSGDDIETFVSQPELLMLYERLVADPLTVRKTWNLTYPDSELERIANLFGITLD
jgi:putative GTP pyrophosphokinase